MTLRTHDASVRHISAICGAVIPTFEASNTAARWRVHRCLARFESRLSRTPSSCNNGLTNTSAGRIITSTVKMPPKFAIHGEFPVQQSLKGHLEALSQRGL